MSVSPQKALVVLEEKQPWKLLNDWPILAPGPDEVLVKIISVALNLADWLIQTHGISWVKYPFIGGLDGAGFVEEVGAAVTNLAKGDKILFPGSFETSQATFKHYCITPAANAAKVRLGQAALVIGGSSSVGQYAIQLARLSGFSPIIATASLRHEGFLKAIGATHVVDRSLPSADILNGISKLTGGKPSHGLLADKVKEGDGKRVARPFASLQRPETKALGVELYKRLTEWVKTGVIVPNRIELLPNGLAGITDGLESMKNNQVSGTKFIVNPQQTP